MFQSYSVGELSRYILDLFTLDENLQNIWVTGEVSNMKQASSGHCYFTLKDAKAQIKCVMWASDAKRLSSIPRDGDDIQAHGTVSVYEAQGAYQLYVDRLRPVGLGDLYQQFERLKQQLQDEGLFDEERKRPIPTFPKIIGVVTSADAAAFQDIQNVLRGRFPIAKVIISSTLVQGDGAPPQIVLALEALNRRDDIDVILLIRGGGSIEDLWAFNDERVARAIVASRIPIISGVGHETDFTIADFAADLRAPTPSAAAMTATPDIADLAYSLGRLDERLNDAIEDDLDARREDVEAIARTLGHISPLARVRNLRQRIDDWNDRLAVTQRSRMALLHERLSARSAALRAANPEAILQRGYAIVTRDADGRMVASVDDAKPGVAVHIQLRDGKLPARIESDTHEPTQRSLF